MKNFNCIIALIVITLMCAIAEISSQSEIIFPEVAALVMGCFLLKKQPWVVNKLQMWLIMTLCSSFGILIVSYLHQPLIFQVLAGFMSVVCVLNLSRTTLVPAVSACILPILCETCEWIYPLSVSVITAVIVLLQFFLEKCSIREAQDFRQVGTNLKEDLLRYSKLFLCLMIIAAIAVYSGHLYIIAPPLVVTFIEFSAVDSPLRQKPLEVVGFVGLASIIQVSVLTLRNYLHFSLTAAALCGCVILFFILEKAKFYFPPLGAILLLPLILPQQSLIWYPFETTLGAALFVFASLALFKEKQREPAYEHISSSDK